MRRRRGRLRPLAYGAVIEASRELLTVLRLQISVEYHRVRHLAPDRLCIAA